MGEGKVKKIWKFMFSMLFKSYDVDGLGNPKYSVFQMWNNYKNNIFKYSFPHRCTDVCITYTSIA